jgi:hypothetical protein
MFLVVRVLGEKDMDYGSSGAPKNNGYAGEDHQQFTLPTVLL